VSEKASGFIYVVSVTGTTGTRTELPADLVEFIQRVRGQIDLPLVLGFGISTPEHARQLNGLLLDGFIVGSALTRAIGSGGLPAMKTLTASLRQALD
jgi:tryptophan synthase alpha chain